MIERGEHLCFALEAGQPIGSSANGRQDLQRDVATSFGVARAIHLTHAARTKRREDVVGADAITGRESQRHCLILWWRAPEGRQVVHILSSMALTRQDLRAHPQIGVRASSAHGHSGDFPVYLLNT